MTRGDKGKLFIRFVPLFTLSLFSSVLPVARPLCKILYVRVKPLHDTNPLALREMTKTKSSKDMFVVFEIFTV